MNLLIFHPTIAPYRIDLFNDLCCAFHTRVCLMYKNLKSQHFDYDQIASKFCFTPEYLKEKWKIGRYTIYSGYWRHLREFHPDIVIVGEFGLGTLAVLTYKWFFQGGFKIVSVCDDSYDMVAEDNDFSWTHRIARKVFVPMLDDLILVEPRTVEWYKQHYNKGVYFPIIREEKRARRKYEALLPLSRMTMEEYKLKGKCVFLFVGRLVALKNVSTVIRAFSKLDQSTNALVIVGDGTEKENLHKLSETLCVNVFFTGRLEDDFLYQWYNIAHCFILASYKEPFGAVTNEALLAGCWCLISNKAGSQCLVEEGVNGYTFNPMDEDELVEKMEKVRSNMIIDETEKLRPNLMRVDYGERMTNLINTLKA